MLTLAFKPPEAVPIGGRFSCLIDDGRHCCCSNLQLVDFHLEQDRDAMLLRLAKFAEAGVDRRLLRKLFKVSRSTLDGRSTNSECVANSPFSSRPRGNREASVRSSAR